MTAQRVPRGRPRAGFTLIELMIVVVIIAILVSLLVPAVASAMRNAREGQVKTEISQLATACSDFKAQFGINPPSYIDLRCTPPTTGSLPPRTQAILRRLWPNINIAGLTTELHGDTSRQRVLEGSGALVFFLGGMIPAAGEAPVGFSSNPRAPLALGGKRVGPFFEFRVDRLYDADPATFNGYEGYLDPLPGQQVPYHYVTNEFYAATETANAAATAATQATMRPVYRQGASSFFNAQSFQIISPGQDGTNGEHDGFPGGAYGIGGVLNTQTNILTDNLPAAHTLKGLAQGDADNITNFSSGRLIP